MQLLFVAVSLGLQWRRRIIVRGSLESVRPEKWMFIMLSHFQRAQNLVPHFGGPFGVFRPETQRQQAVNRLFRMSGDRPAASTPDAFQFCR